LSAACIDETGEHCDHVRFGMDGIYPRVSRAVIYEGNIIVGFAKEVVEKFPLTSE